MINSGVGYLSICGKINFEVLTAMVMNCFIFWDITLYSLSMDYTALYPRR
jgi:hypothetical protein